MEQMDVIVTETMEMEAANKWSPSDIQVFENAFPIPILEGVQQQVDEKGFSFGWKSNRKKGYSHWNSPFAGKSTDNREDITSELTKDIASLWGMIQYKYSPNYVPVRAYANGYTLGTEGYIHTDSKIDTDRTYLVYLNKTWERDWAGETLFLEKDIIHKAVLPKYNRLVVFPSSMDHVARSVSRIYTGLRTIFVFKAKVIDNVQAID